MIPANILLPDADLLPKLTVGTVVMLLVGFPLSIEVRRRRAARLAKDAEDYGIIDCLIRYPKALPGSLRERWAPGSAELKHGTIVFRQINSSEPFGADQAGAPQVHEVRSDPEQLELPRIERKVLHGSQQVIRLDTDKGVIDLAADRTGLGALTQRVYRGEKD